MNNGAALTVRCYHRAQRMETTCERLCWAINVTHREGWLMKWNHGTFLICWKDNLGIRVKVHGVRGSISRDAQHAPRDSS